MGFNFCAGFGILMGVCATVLIIFGQIGQINSSSVPRHLRLVSVNATGLGQVTSFGAALYYNGTAGRLTTVAAGQGIRPVYEWGNYDGCAHFTLGSVPSYCENTRFGYRWQPANTIINDAPAQYQSPLRSFLNGTVFADSSYTGRYTHAANWLMFFGAIFAGITMLIGLVAHRFAFVLGALTALIGALLLAVGLVMWTVIIARVRNSVSFANAGISVNYGNGLWISWAACGALFLAIIPYLIACCTGRRDTY